jgi:3,4-dihydroxy-9,10-secoandrosta-1,3,5(10)-triene-9,17-dione 4,5-dioxygenase
MEIHGLGYVGVASPEPEAWLCFATEVVGLMPARVLPGEDFAVAGAESGAPASRGSGIAADGSVYLKADDHQWRVAVHPGKSMGLAYLGFELADGPAFDRALEELTQQGIEVQESDAKLASARGVRRLAQLRDPADNALELFCLPASDRHFLSPQGAEFLTGALGLGHVNLLVPNLQECIDFYTGALGFRLSDFIEFGPGLASHFFRCNPRHHSLGLTCVGEHRGLHHLMLEMKELDDVGQALDRAKAAGIPITSTLGRHKNDHMLSFYMQSPAGFDVEIGTGGRLCGDDWLAHEFCEGDIWGHEGLTAEAILEATLEREEA